ncbi:MAG TPA: sensor domain-containing diguanylate cyclase [Gaiellaceae bacterium]|nr:sensor domain-containing diguanylate cyclase [Gaiellaceae bacterium]
MFVLICALGALLLAVSLTAVLAVRKARAETDERVAEAVASLAAGMQQTMRELATSVAGDAQPRPEIVTAELAASLDLEEVTERTLEAASAVPGVEAVVLDSAGAGGERVTGTLGMHAEEAAKASVGLPENDNLRAIEVTYRYRLDDVDEASPLVRSGVVLPVRSDGTSLGTLAAFTRSSSRRLGEGEIGELERLAFRAGPALDNARRYQEARALADLDALTGTHNRRFFHETLAREVARAQRYRRQLSLIVFDLDDFKSINDRVGHLAGDAVLAEAAARMLSVVRSADVACRVGGDEFAIVLPESSAGDAELLAGRIARAIGERPISGVAKLELSAGVAELRPGDRPNELFERADEALYRAKELGKARTVLANGESA